MARRFLHLESGPAPDSRGGNGRAHNNGGDQLHVVGRDIEAQGSGVDAAVDDAARHDTQHPPDHGALADKCLADDQRGQSQHYHAGAAVYIGKSAVLGHHGSGQAGHGISHTKAHCNGKGGIDGGGPHHIRVVAGGPDGQPQPGTQKQHQQNSTLPAQ